MFNSDQFAAFELQKERARDYTKAAEQARLVAELHHDEDVHRARYYLRRLRMR
jgi:hypothetical protein